MSKELVRNQYVVSLRNGMVAYIVADKIEDIAGALQKNKFFNTKEEMLINTADIVAIMSPREWDEQLKYQRGWYKSSKGTAWYNKKGEYEQETDLGAKFSNAEKALEEVRSSQDKEEAIKLLKKLETSETKHLIVDLRRSLLADVEELAGKLLS